MSPPRRLDTRYRQIMRHHPFGYALYKPVLRSLMKPGCCGYFNDSGFWIELFDLNELSSLSKYNLGHARDTSQQLREAEISWEPKISRGASKVDTGLSAGTITGLPVDVGFHWKVAASRGHGAVLVTNPPIYHHCVYQEFDIRPWFHRNKQQILIAPFAAQIKQHGLFIVTGTYSTTGCSIACWTDSSNDVSLGFNASLIQNPVAGVQGGWYLENSASGWSHYNAPGNDRYVVFVTGLLFKPRPVSAYLFTSIMTDSEMRHHVDGNTENAEDPTDWGGIDVEFTCERFGGLKETAMSEHSEGPSKWAILVGIDHYINPPSDPRPYIPPLRGCVEDCNALEACFKDFLGLDTEHICKLTAPAPPPEDQTRWPTKQNIMKAMQSVYDKASPGDLVYIHFSGHGARVMKSGVGYVLVPMDFKEKENYSSYLTAAEIKEHLRQMLDKKLVITVVLDCCHSGGFGRGEEASEGVDGLNLTVRGLDDITNIVWASQDTDSDVQEAADALQLHNLDDNDGRGMSTLSHWLIPTSGEYTVMAACRELERAYELKLEDGKYRGVLTHCILSILSNTEALVHGLSGLSYWRLQWHVAEAVRQVLGAFHRQNVLIKGATDRAFFGVSQLELSNGPVVTELEKPVGIKKRVWLNALTHLGARVGAKFAIYPLTVTQPLGKKQPSEPVTLCEVTSVDNGRAEAVLTKINESDGKQIVEGCPAVPQDESGEKLVQLVKQATGPAAETEVVDLEAVRLAWNSFTPKYARLVSDDWSGPTWLQVTVNEEKQEYQILDKVRAVVSIPGPALCPVDETAAALVSRVMHLAKFHSVREMTTRSQSENLMKVEILGKIPPNDQSGSQDVQKYRASDRLPAYIQRCHQFDGSAGNTVEYYPGDILALSITNVSTEVLHINLMCLDMSDYSIMAVYPEGTVAKPIAPDTLDPGFRLQIPIKHKPPAGASEVPKEGYEENVKVFAATRPIDFAVLLLPSIEEDRRGGGDGQQEGDFWGIYEEVMDYDRAWEVAGELRRAVDFEVKDLIIKVMPVKEDRGLQWDDYF